MSHPHIQKSAAAKSASHGLPPSTHADFVKADPTNFEQMNRSPYPPRTIAIDLTRLQPGGVSGGVRVVSIELVQQLAAEAPHWNFLVLTAARSHEELAVLDRTNVRRVCLGPTQSNATEGTPLRFSPKELVRHCLRHRHLAFVRSIAWRYLWRPRRLELLEAEQVDALLLPLTTPSFHSPKVPTVAVVYDLQHVDYPEFFRRDDRTARDVHLATLIKFDAKLICISEHTRCAFEKHLGLKPYQATTIHFGLRAEFPKEIPNNVERTVANYGLEPGDYWFYPANSWPHKNHVRLFEAFAAYVQCHESKTTKLVCCGADTGGHAELRRTIRRLQLEGSVQMIGYVPDDALIDLMSGSRGVVFPSLYEGFGMPVLEAMACGVPVACSNVTSLPEVVGDAALLFDPKQIASITGALEQLDNPEVASNLVTAGRQRAAQFDTVAAMARRFLDVLEEACGGGKEPLHAISSHCRAK